MTEYSATHLGTGTIVVFAREEDGLSQTVYTFWYNSSIHRLGLTKYTYQTRPSLRHKFRIINLWDRLDKQNSNIRCPITIPYEVIDMARDMFTSSLSIGFVTANLGE